MIKMILALWVLMVSVIQLLALNPVKEYANNPGDYGLTYYSVKIKTEDKLELQGWFYKATDKQSRKVIILSDDGDGNMADLIELASNFLSLGYNVLTYDYRGYGGSDEFKINKNFFIYSQFEKDLNAAISYVKKDYGSLKTVHLYGIGVGAGLSIGVGVNRPEVSKIIADSPYLTFEQTQKRYEAAYGQTVMMPLGYDKTIMEPLYALQEKGSGLTGIFLISGSADPVFTPGDMKELSKLKKKMTQTFLVKDANKTNTFSSNKNAYFEAIKDFLDN